MTFCETLCSLTKFEERSFGHHMCFFHEGADEQKSILHSFVCQGFCHNEKILYVAKIGSDADIVGRLLLDEIDIDKKYGLCKLCMRHSHAFYKHDGRFDPESIISIIHDEITQALDEGYTGLRIIVDMSWILDSDGGDIEKLLEYEAAVNVSFHEKPCSFLCQYDNRIFSDDIRLRLLEVYSEVVIGEKVCNVNPYYIPEREESSMQHRLSNIMALQNLKDEMNEIEIQYNSLLEHSKDGIVVYAPFNDGEDFVFVEFNKSGEDAEGLLREEVIGRKVTGVFPGIIDFGLFEVFKRVYKTGIPEVLPLTLYKDKKFEGWRENYVYKLPSGNIVALYSDETKHMRALMKSEKKYRSLAENAHVGLFRTRLSDGMILACNDQMAKNVGFSSASEVIGHPSTDWYYDPEDRKKMVELFNDDKCLKDFSLRIKNERDESRWILFTACVSENGESLEGFAMDITDKKMLEEKTERMNEELVASMEHAKLLAVKAEAANNAKNAFLANMSHEIRTPMNGVIGMASLLAKMELAPRQRQYVDVILRSSYSLMSIINDVFDFSKIEAGKIDVDIVMFDIVQMLDDVSEIFSLKAEEKGITYTYGIDTSVPRMVVGAQVRVRQVLSNIINNAIKFTEKGHVDVGVRVDQESGEHIVLRFDVMDTGIGIEKEMLNVIFEAFTQVDGSLSRKYEGAGLGLSISRKLLEIMGGDINVITTLGEGTTFSFIVPLTKVTKKITAENGDEDDNVCRNETVLSNYMK